MGPSPTGLRGAFRRQPAGFWLTPRRQGAPLLEGSTPSPRIIHQPPLPGGSSQPHCTWPQPLSLMLVWLVLLGCPQRSGVGQGRAPRGRELSCPITSSSHRQPGQRDPGQQAPIIAGGGGGGEAAPKRPCGLGGRHDSGIPEFKTSKATVDNRKRKDLFSPKMPARARTCEPRNPRAPGEMLTSPSPSLSLSLSFCPAAGLSGFPSGVTLTWWSGKVDDPFLRATQEVC